MRLVSFRAEDEVRPGALRGDEVIDISPLAPSVLALIEAGDDALAAAGELAREAVPFATLDRVGLAAPIPQPRGHLYCVGWNYVKHFNEGIGRRGDRELELPGHPALFTKPPDCVIGPGAPIAYCDQVTTTLDSEAELALVIGRRGRSIPESDALGHVFGYTLANDVTARDVQRRHGGQWLKGKGMDTYCPMGPVLVTADEIPDPGRLHLRGEVNDEVRQDADLSTMIFPIPRLIAELSFGMTLHPGDVVLTGTPEGVGFGRTPQVFLGPGDVCRITIEEIGTLSNPVRELDLAAAL